MYYNNFHINFKNNNNKKNKRTAIKLIKDIRPVAKPNSLFKRILINLDQ